jgi:hypothetical protein
MKTHNICCSTLLVLLSWRTVKSQEQQPKSQVTLSLDKFEELFTSARLEEAERRLKDQRKILEAEHKAKLEQLQEETSAKLFAEAKRQRDALFPENYQILQHTATGYFNSSASENAGVARDVASFDMEMILRVWDSKWAAVPIVNTNSTVTSDWTVFWKSDENEEFLPVDSVANSDAMLVQRGMQQVLATNRSGLFKVRFKAHTRVGKTRNLNKLGMSSMLHSLSGFSLRIAGNVRDFSVQPTESVLTVLSSVHGYTDFNITLPLTADGVDIRWLEGETSTADETAAVDGEIKDDKPQVTAMHEALHSVGEGIIQSSHILEFTASSESSALNFVDFVVRGKGVRITSIGPQSATLGNI